MQNITQRVLEKFLTSPIAKGFEDEVYVEHEAKRQAVVDRIASLRAQRVAACVEPDKRLEVAKKHFDEVDAQHKAAGNELSAAQRAAQRAQSMHHAEIYQLQQQLAALDATRAAT